MIVQPSIENIKKAASLLRRGDVVVFPTETVYGIGADARNDSAIRKIYQLKGRPSSNPLIVHLPDIASVKALIPSETSPGIFAAVDKLSQFWPGPLTIIVPKHKSISSIATGGLHTVGLRIPNHPVALTLLKTSGVPLAAPSANPSNYVSPTTATHVATSLGEAAPMILDGGATYIGIESTVLSLLDPKAPVIVRPGAVTREEIARALGISPELIHIADTQSDAPLSPGLLETHYAPKTRLQFLSEVDLWALAPQKIGYIAFSEGQHLDFDFHAITVLSRNENLDEVAAGLFSALQEMDSLQLDLVVIDSCKEHGIGLAIMNRLKRAVTKR